MNLLSPKSDFLEDEKRAGEWQDIAMSPLFKDAAKHALLAYELSLTESYSEGPALAVAGLRLQGARGFLEILMNIGAHVKLPSDRENDQLTPV